MSNIKNDVYSHLKFFQALVPQDIATGAATNGLTVDTRGYHGCVFVVNCGALTGGGALSLGDAWQIKLEHGLASAAGVSVWSEVYPSQMIHSVIGMAGAYSALNSGIFQSIASTTDLSAGTGALFKVGYIGPRRYVRITFSYTGLPSTLSAGAVAALGFPSDWSVSEPVGN